MPWLALGTSPAATLLLPVPCAATVEKQLPFWEELSSCFYCVNDFACVSPMLSLTKGTDWVSLLVIIPMLLSFRSHTSTVSGCIINFVSFQPLPGQSLFIKTSISQFFHFLSVSTISGVTFGIVLRVDSTNPRNRSAPPITSNASYFLLTLS